MWGATGAWLGRYPSATGRSAHRRRPRSGPDGGTPPGHGSTHGPSAARPPRGWGRTGVAAGGACAGRRGKRGGDAVKPRPPRRSVAQAGEFAPAAQQGLLDAVLGILQAAHHAIAMAPQLAAHGAGQGGKGASTHTALTKDEFRRSVRRINTLEDL